MSQENTSHENTSQANTSHENTSHENTSHENNQWAGQGPVLLDIGGDVGALIVTMPPSMRGAEVEIRPSTALCGPGVDADTSVVPTHVGVVGRATGADVVDCAVFPALLQGRYELTRRPGGDVRLTVMIEGGEDRAGALAALTPPDRSDQSRSAPSLDRSEQVCLVPAPPAGGRPIGPDDVVDPDLAAIGARLADGDPQAVADCYRALGPGVAALLRRYVPPADVEDVLQRVFYQVWRSHAGYDQRFSLRGWVFGIARKRAIDHLRRSGPNSASTGRMTLVPLEDIGDIAGEDGRLDTERLDTELQLRAALAQLPEGQRDVIVMAFFDGYTQAEIAEFLGIPLGTVKTRTFRGLRRLAELLHHERADHE